MLVSWRIVKQKYAATAFDGEGAYKYGGRWNSPGTRVVYTSATLSLAALETLVHLNPMTSFLYVAFQIRFSKGLVDEITAKGLQRGWKDEPPGPVSMRIGDRWLRAGRTAVLSVPSALVPTELNYVLNPAHPDYAKIIIGKPEPFAFDPRLLSVASAGYPIKKP